MPMCFLVDASVVAAVAEGACVAEIGGDGHAVAGEWEAVEVVDTVEALEALWKNWDFAPLDASII